VKAARLDRVRKMRGIVYVPSYARGPQDSLGVLFRHDVIRRELAFIPALGLNGVRLWLQISAYEATPDLYLENLRFFLDWCLELGLDVHLNLFDSVGVDPEDTEARPITKAEAFRSSLRNRAMKVLFRIGQTQDLMQVPETNSPLALMAEFWMAGPGYRHLGDDEWPRCERYVRAIASVVRDHPSVVMLEVMNEPEMATFFRRADYAPVTRFYKAMLLCIADAAPDMPTTIGSSSLKRFQQADSDTGRQLDVISFHSFKASPKGLERDFEKAIQYAAATGDRPVMCSEWGTYPGATDEDQLRIFRDCLPVVLRSGAGWEVVHLIAGYCNGAMASLLNTNGSMRPAAVQLRKTMLGVG